jgi:HSP20 family molecular chaperone IbpA
MRFEEVLMRATGAAKAPKPAVRLTPTRPSEVEWAIRQIENQIARRAYELFQLRGCEHGHDWEDWFRAESELLRPISVAISESGQRVSVRVNVFGFEAGELKVSVDPAQVTVLGSKNPKTSTTSDYPDQTFRIIELPSNVNPEAAAIAFESGVIKLELFKAETSPE